MEGIGDDTPLDTRIKLNVGGAHFETTLRLLRKFPDSLLGTMFSGRVGGYGLVRPDEHGEYFLDRDPMLFALILHFLRQGE
jgi:hypothetical protein